MVDFLVMFHLILYWCWGSVVASYTVSNVVTFFLFHILKERIKVYEQNGTKIIIEEDPVLAVVIVTPMMQRAHSLPLASKIVFMDNTSSMRQREPCYNIFANTV